MFSKAIIFNLIDVSTYKDLAEVAFSKTFKIISKTFDSCLSIRGPDVYPHSLSLGFVLSLLFLLSPFYYYFCFTQCTTLFSSCFFVKSVTWDTVGTASMLYQTILRNKLNDLFTGFQLKNAFKILFCYLLRTDPPFQDIMHNIATVYYVFTELFHYFFYLLNFELA